MTHSFRLHCLGTPALFTVAGEQVPFRTRKHLALLVRLALDPGKQFTRDYLADLFWPDAPPKHANHSLAQGLSVIKAKIAREAVVLRRATVGLAAGWIDVDVQHLSEAEVAIDGPFMDGFEIPGARPFEDWKDEYRARLSPQVRDCLVRQMDAARRIGDFVTVERHATRLQDLDPLAEEGIRGVMEARAWASDRSSALKAFARYEARLKEELGAKPGPELVRMADLLRDGRRSPRPAVAGYPPERADRRFEPETLIGREREFSVLYDAWLEARRKCPRIVVVTSDPGVGKTTLVNAFAASCQMEGAVVARAQAYDAERELPFAVLGELVKQLTTQRAIGSADPEALSELTRISSEIVKVFPGVPKPMDWSRELMPLRIADAFLKTVTAAALDCPVVLVVDDIHVADNASIAVLHTVARKLNTARVLMALVGRVSELRLSVAADALTSDESLSGLVNCPLDILSNHAAECLVRRLVVLTNGRAQPPVERILRAACGNPLAIELLTREWMTHESTSLLDDLEALDTQPVAAVGIPRAIGKMFERQARRLDNVSRSVLDTAAVLGRRLCAVELYAASDITAGQAAEALSRLRDERLLRDVHGDLEFRNELIRAQAYYALAAPLRQNLHAKVAALLSLKEPKGEALNLEIGWHYLRGGLADRAAPFAVAGAQGALAAGAPAEAQQILEALLALICDDDLKRRMQLLLVKALLDRSNASKAMPILEALSGLMSLTPKERAEVTRLITNAEFLLAKSPGNLRLAVAQVALEAARETNDVELLLKALLEYARTCKNLGDERGIRRIRCETAKIVDAGSHLAAAYLTIAYCDFYTYEIDSALLSLKKVAQETERDLAQLAFVHSGIGSCYHCLCNFPEALRHLKKALESAERVGDDSRSSRILSNLTLVCTTLGHYEEAIELGCRSVELGRRSLNQPELVTACANLGDAYLLTGDRQRATECLEHAKEWIRTHDDWYMTVVYLLENASRALASGNVALALKIKKDVDRLAGGSDRLYVHGGLNVKLDALKLLHDNGPDPAKNLAKERKNFFRTRVPLFYLDALAVFAWLEKSIDGRYSTETIEELRLFDTWGAIGKRALLEAQGFLS